MQTLNQSLCYEVERRLVTDDDAVARSPR